MNVPFLDLKASYDEFKSELDAAYHRVMESGWYVLGSEVEAFEAELSFSETTQRLFNGYTKLYKALGGGWLSEEELKAAQDQQVQSQE